MYNTRRRTAPAPAGPNPNHLKLLQRLRELPKNQKKYWKTQQNRGPEFWSLLAEALGQAEAERSSWIVGLQGLKIQVVHLREYKQTTRSTAHRLKSIQLAPEVATVLSVPVYETLNPSLLVAGSHNMKLDLMGVYWWIRNLHSDLHWFVLECTTKSYKYHFQRRTIYLPKPSWFEALQVVTSSKDITFLIFAYTDLVD